MSEQLDPRRGTLVWEEEAAEADEGLWSDEGSGEPSASYYAWEAAGRPVHGIRR